jgi:hypothetical protein
LLQDGKNQRSAGIPSFGDVPLGDLEATTVRAWKAARIAEGLAPPPDRQQPS